MSSYIFKKVIRSSNLTFLISLLVFASVCLAMGTLTASATERPLERAVIRTGDATSRSIVVQEVNISRVRRDSNSVAIGSTIDSIKNDSKVQISNNVLSSVNSGTNSTNSGNASEKFKTLSLRNLGLLQLAAHDLFNVDRDTEIDHENGKLDLSTLLDHGDEFVATGGEPRNRENIFLFSVAKGYGELYERYLDRGNSKEQARKKLIRKYHKELNDVYKELFDEDLPEPKAGEVTFTENLALRTIHDFLPGLVMINGELKTPVDASLIGVSLTKQELKKQSGPLDGLFDPVFLDVVITIPPSTVLHINLLERDSSFGTQFNTEHTFEYFMSELENGEYDHDDLVYKYIDKLFAKGLNFD